MGKRSGTWGHYIPSQTGGTTADATLAVHPECLMSVQALATDGPTTIHDGPALLFGVFVNTTIGTAAVLLTDAAVTKVTLPVGLAAGVSVNLYGARFETSLKIDPGDSSTGDITVFYRPI